MSRPRPAPIIHGEVPPEAWELEPIDVGGPGRRNRPKIAKATRERVYARDNYRCRNCGATDDLSIDHIKPLSKGGANRFSNMQTLCKACNLAKADKPGSLAPKRRRAPKPPARESRRSRLEWAYSVLGLNDPD